MELKSQLRFPGNYLRDSSGFTQASLRCGSSPRLGELQQAKGIMPHPDGDITVSLQRKGKEGIAAEIILPAQLTGEFIWKGKTIKLTGGSKKLPSLCETLYPLYLCVEKKTAGLGCYLFSTQRYKINCPLNR
jgi:hypothetical protein